MSHPADGILDDLRSRRTALAVIGLGYVGLPLACCLAKRFRVVGFDVNPRKISELRAGRDPVGETGDAGIAASGIEFTGDPAALKACRFIVIAVPTPVDTAKRPDFAPLVGASKTLGAHLPKGSIVVYESTVYPGATEEVCIPELARASGLLPGVDFAFGYSPERINPGDREHTVERITKVVSGSDGPTLDCVAGVYGDAITAGVHRAASVKVAEAAKVIENTQRDLNIALMNELSLIFHRIGIDTHDVLAAARTKWNFLPFVPGLVGGHCIGVDPYYLTHKAEELGYHPEVILAGRRINDGMGEFVARECVRLLALQGRPIKGARVLVLGLTFKEDCPDVRNTRVVDIIAELERFGCSPVVIDPVADAAEARHEYGVGLVPGEPLPKADAAVLAVAHKQFRALPAAALAAALPAGAPVLDVKNCLDRSAMAEAGLGLWRL
jgi:UDP-N-acetyl-D-galactosamine dehydrogenase